MNLKSFWRVSVAGVVAVVLCVSVAAYLLLGGAVRAERNLYVSARADYATLCDSLLPVLRHKSVFNLLANSVNLSTTFQPGHYALRPGMSIARVVRMLKLGRQTPVRVTLNNLRTPAQLAVKLSERLDADSATWMAAFTSQKLAREVDFDSVTLFSMFIPNTYEFYWTVTPYEFVHQMRKEYDRFWTAERDAQRERSGLSRVEVMTLASIVNEETRRQEEMARIAGVYINRLRCGMPLQADPTVKYALQDFGLRRIMQQHLKFRSPYNTYIYKGLPPSPICMPDVVTIDAVLHFEQHNYLYFCASPTFDGSHLFARTLPDHAVHARAYRAALNARNIK
ncbi:MAG: endolytic transglycosylase MltG [Alistipes sp.]